MRQTIVLYCDSIRISTKLEILFDRKIIELIRISFLSLFYIHGVSLDFTIS